MTRVLLTMMVGLLVSSCGFGSESSSEGSDLDDSGRDRSDDVQPAGTDPDAVTPYISELLLAYDRTVNEISADPDVARDPEDPLIQEFLALFDVDDQVEQDFIDGWVDQADEGLRIVPFSEDYPALTSTVDGEVESVSEDEVWFPICVVERSREVYGTDDGGDEVDSEGDGDLPPLPRIDRPGEATAVRVDGQWVLGQFVISQQELGCNEG